ncbi:MAG: BACON domain-containing protein [Bacteroidales bacterium]|nr:BACON domain-containing protein [Bacteroidales bacterium]
MKLRNFIYGLMAVAGFAACQPEDTNLGVPDIEVSAEEMSFDAAGGEQTLTVTATRDWMVDSDYDWVVVSPESGKASSAAQTVTVTVLENTGMDRTADLKFTIGMKSRYLTVSQAGPGGSADALVVYSNDFDKTKAEKGSNGWATYLDSFEGWLNATGSGVETVTYGFDRMTARTNSGNGSAGSYSDYVALGASGMNYLWFGSGTPYFAVKNITLPEGKTNFTLSFGTERYLYEATDNTFNWNEFKAYISADGKKWVKLVCDFAGGVLPNGRWDLAMSTFTVPAGTSSLYVYFVSSLGSAYALDDLKLVQSAEAGKTVDFASGEEFEVGDNTTGGNTGGGETAPESKGKKSVAEFINAADTQNYYELTGKVSGFNPTYCSFDLTDDSGKIYVYSVLDASKSEWTSKISNGGTITIYGKYLYYEQKSQHEVVDAYIVSFNGDGGSSDGGEQEGKPESLVKATVAEFLAAEESTEVWYELTGEITSIVTGNAYGNLYINDGTGEVYIYGLTNGWVGYNDKSFDSIGLKVGDTVTLGTLRGSYNGNPQGGGSQVPAYYISHEAGEGGSEEGGNDNPGEAGEYEPQGVTWTLGEKAYDKTSGNNAQNGTVNGVSVNNMLKLGTGSAVGNATLHVAAGTSKIGFYCVAWKGKNAQVKFSVDGTEVTTIEPSSNAGATGNPPYASITVSSSDYYEVTLPSKDVTDIKVETLDPSNGRVIFIGFKAITE